MIALLDPVKSMILEQFADKVTESVLLFDHAGHAALVVAVDSETTNIKGIRSTLSTTRIKKHSKGKHLGLKSCETNFTIDSKMFRTQLHSSREKNKKFYEQTKIWMRLDLAS